MSLPHPHPHSAMYPADTPLLTRTSTVVARDMLAVSNLLDRGVLAVSGVDPPLDDTKLPTRRRDRVRRRDPEDPRLFSGVVRTGPLADRDKCPESSSGAAGAGKGFRAADTHAITERGGEDE